MFNHEDMYDKNFEKYLFKIFNRFKNLDESTDFRVNQFIFLDDLINKLENSSSDDSGEKKEWISDDGTYYFSYKKSIKQQPKKTDKETIEFLEQRLEHLVANENYESAIKVRDLIKSLKDKNN